MQLVTSMFTVKLYFNALSATDNSVWMKPTEQVLHVCLAATFVSRLWYFLLSPVRSRGFALFFPRRWFALTRTLSVQDPSHRFKGDVMDLRLDIERRKRFAGREREDKRSPGGSRGPSRDRSSEKSGKRHKKSKYVSFISISVNRAQLALMVP